MFCLSITLSSFREVHVNVSLFFFLLFFVLFFIIPRQQKQHLGLKCSMCEIRCVCACVLVRVRMCAAFKINVSMEHKRDGNGVFIFPLHISQVAQPSLQTLLRVALPCLKMPPPPPLPLKLIALTFSCIHTKRRKPVTCWVSQMEKKSPVFHVLQFQIWTQLLDIFFSQRIFFPPVVIVAMLALWSYPSYLFAVIYCTYPSAKETIGSVVDNLFMLWIKKTKNNNPRRIVQTCCRSHSGWTNQIVSLQVKLSSNNSKLGFTRSWFLYRSPITDHRV